MNIGIFYGSTYGNTAAAAKLLQTELERLPNVAVESFDIAFCDIAKMLEFDVVLLGCSTWYVGEVQDDWYDKARGLNALAWRGKPVGLFGSGDQMTYAETFQDALGIIGEQLERGGATLVGFTPVLGYKHVSSKAQRGQHFIGLALDDDNEAKLTEPRVKLWVAQLAKELHLIAAPALVAAD
jgi:flavodoxin I